MCGVYFFGDVGDVFAPDCPCSRLAMQQLSGNAAQASPACWAPINKSHREQRWPSCSCIPMLQEDMTLGAGSCWPASQDAAASLAHGPFPEHRVPGRGSQECRTCSAVSGLAVLAALARCWSCQEQVIWALSLCDPAVWVLSLPGAMENRLCYFVPLTSF